MSVPVYQYRLTEEICRWAFEVALQSTPDWQIAFTNPTAGPWKRLMAAGADGKAGEVHRFEREETRPDLVIVSDELRAVAIIEAKDDLAKLRAKDQMSKTVAMLARMSALLKAEAENPYWGARAAYRYCPGLLWGASRPTDPAVRATLIAEYRAALSDHAGLTAAPLLLVECLRAADDAITCAASADIAAGEDPAWAQELAASLSH